MEKGCTPISNWEASRNAALAKIKRAAKNSGNEVLKEIAKEEDPAARIERSKNSDVIEKIVFKCIQNYRDGEYSYKKTIAMICDALKQVK